MNDFLTSGCLEYVDLSGNATWTIVTTKDCTKEVALARFLKHFEDYSYDTKEINLSLNDISEHIDWEDELWMITI